MTPEREAEIRGWVSDLDDLPDGAFLAVLEERGVSVEDLADVYGEEA